MRIRSLGIAGVAALFALGSSAGGAFAAPSNGSPGSSSASISLSGCVLESSKEISNIEYFTAGSSVFKDETMNTLTYDLAAVPGIENIDTVSVKAGTTVETFGIECPNTPDPGDGENGSDDGGSGDDGPRMTTALR